MAGSGRKLLVDLRELVQHHVLYLFFYSLGRVKTDSEVCQHKRAEAEPPKGSEFGGQGSCAWRRKAGRTVSVSTFAAHAAKSGSVDRVNIRSAMSMRAVR